MPFFLMTEATSGAVRNLRAGIRLPDSPRVASIDLVIVIRTKKTALIAGRIFENEINVRGKRIRVQSELFGGKLKKTLNVYHNAPSKGRRSSTSPAGGGQKDRFEAGDLLRQLLRVRSDLRTITENLQKCSRFCSRFCHLRHSSQT
jgi:hypothetical protein